jgi:hypothetical protein
MPEKGNEKLVEGNHLSCRGVFLRTDIAKQFPFNPKRELSGTEDYELWLRLAARFPLYCDNEISSAIIQHDSRSVVNTNIQSLIKRISILEESLKNDSAFQQKFGKNFSTIKSNNCTYIALHLALAKTNRFDAIKYLFKSFLLDFNVIKTRTFYGAIKRLFV